MLAKFNLLIILLVFSISSSQGQCVSAGPRDATTSSNDNSVGNMSWGNLGDICTSNNARCSSTALILGDVTHYLVATGYGFTIPSTAVICGITVEVEKRATGLLESVNDHSVKIVKGGAVVGSEHAKSGVWPSSDTYYTYGSNSDNWGTSWTPADINAANFGVAISANLFGVTVLPSSQVDNVRITVDYDNTLPIDLLYFKTECIDQDVLISWSVAAQHNNDFFTIERTLDGINFEEIAKIDGAGTVNETIDYNYVDVSPYRAKTFYRLKQTDHNGIHKYFDLVENTCSKTKETIVYPNPVHGDQFTVEFVNEKKETCSLTLMDSQGRPVQIINDFNSDKIIFSTSDLQKGLYILQVQIGEEITDIKRVKID